MPMTDRPSAGDLAANGQGPADFGVGIEDIDKTTWAQTWDSLNDFGRGVEGHWKEHVEPAIEDLGPVLEKGLEATAYTAHTVGVVLVTATHEAVDHTMSAMRPAIESSSKAIDEHVMPPLQAFGKDVERSTKQGLRAVGPALAAAATSTAHAIGPALGTSARTIERAGSATMEGLEKGVEKSASATVAAWQKVSEQMAKVRKAVDESDIGRLTDAELEKAWADFKKFIQLDWGNLQDDNLPQLPPVGDRCPLLGSRQFVTDMARLSEQLVMDDLTPDYFPDCVEVELGPTAEQQPNWRAHELQQPNGQTHSPYKLATPAKKPSPPSVAGQSATGAKSGHGDQLSPEILPAPGSTGSSSSSSSSSRRGPVEHPVNPVTASTSPISSTTLGDASASSKSYLPSFNLSPPGSAEERRIEEQRARTHCREQAAFFACDRVGEIPRRDDHDHPELCDVRKRRAKMALELHRRYKPKVLTWIDTQVGLEKQAAVLRFQPDGEDPIIVVVFRGSKKAMDYFVSDAVIVLTALPEPKVPLPAAFFERYRNDRRPGRHVPHCTYGLWGTYAGERDSPKTRRRGQSTKQRGSPSEGVGEDASLSRGASDASLSSMSKAGGEVSPESHPSSPPPLQQQPSPPTKPASQLGELSEPSETPELRPQASEQSQREAQPLPRPKRTTTPSPTPDVDSVAACASAEKLSSSPARGRTREESPRVMVRRAVEKALLAEPNARLALCGHSLGGCIAMLCAYDLATSSTVVDEWVKNGGAGPSIVSFGAPRFFDVHFQRACAALEEAGRLNALRVMIEVDMVARLPPRAMGMRTGCSARVILDPLSPDKPLRYTDDQAERDRMRGSDVISHTCYAIYLASETTPERTVTLPPEVAPLKGCPEHRRQEWCSKFRWPAKTYPSPSAGLFPKDVGEMAGEIAKDVSFIAQEVGERVGELAKQVEESVDQTANNVGEMAHGVSESLGDLAKEVGKGLDENVHEVDKKVDALVEAGSVKAQEVGEKVGEIAKSLTRTPSPVERRSRRCQGAQPS